MDELRARLARAEQDAAAARILAGGADRDVGELGREFREFRTQNNRMLNAMREDITDLRTDLTGLRGDVDRGFALIAEEFAQVDRNFLAIRGVLDGLAAGVQYLTQQKARPGGDDQPPP